MPWEVEASLPRSGNRGELARPANLGAGGPCLAAAAGRAREQALGAASQGQEGAHPAWLSWQETAAQAGKALSQFLSGRGRIRPLRSWRSQSQMRWLRAGPSSQTDSAGAVSAPTAGPSFLPLGLCESQSLCTSFSLLREGRGLLAPSCSGVPVRGPVRKQVGTWEESGHMVGPLAQGFAPP